MEYIIDTVDPIMSDEEIVDSVGSFLVRVIIVNVLIPMLIYILRGMVKRNCYLLSVRMPLIET